MNFRLCDNSDLTVLIRIGRQTYYDTFHSMNTEETMALYLDEAFAVDKISGELNNPESYFYFLYDNDNLVGYMKVSLAPAQSDINDPESLELERIYVLEEFKGMGYGRLMIDNAVNIASENDCRSVWLGVWEKNEPALEFYKKMGFEIVDSQPFRMGEELQTDYIMRKAVTK